MGVRELSETISEGIGAIAAIVAKFEPMHATIGARDMPSDEVDARLAALETALCQLVPPTEIWTSPLVTKEDVTRVRELRRLFLACHDDWGPTTELRRVAEESWAWILNWKA